MNASIRRNSEGITFLVLEPSTYVNESQGIVVIVGNVSGDFCPHVAYAVPIYEPGITADQVVSGGTGVNFTSLPDGVTKVGFPKGFDSEHFDEPALKTHLESAAYDIPASRVSQIITLYEEFVNGDTKALKSEANLNFFNFLVGKPEVACMIPSIFAGFVGALDSDVDGIDGLDNQDKARFHDLSVAISNEKKDTKNIFVSPNAIKSLWKVLPDYVIAGSESLRRVKAVVGIQLLSTLSTASVFSKVHSATERDIDKIIDEL